MTGYEGRTNTLNLFDLDTIDAVSYTHLDVYKRQGVHAAPRRGKSYPQPALPAAGRLAEPRLTQPYNTEESIMEKRQYICPKCGCQQYESDRLQADVYKRQVRRWIFPPKTTTP